MGLGGGQHEAAPLSKETHVNLLLQPKSARNVRFFTNLNCLVFVLYAGLLAGAKTRRQKISGDVRLKMVKMQTDIAMEDKKFGRGPKGHFC
jgi:hypothetical protein